MIEAPETLQLLSEVIEKMSGPLLPERKAERAVFVGDTHTAIDVSQTVLDKYYDDADIVVFLGD